MAGTSELSSTFMVQIFQDAAAQEQLRTSQIGRAGTILAMRVDAYTVAAGTRLQVFKVDADGVATSISPGTFAAPASVFTVIGGAPWNMIANTSQWIPLQLDPVLRTFAATDSLQISVSAANARLKVNFLCIDSGAFAPTVTTVP